MSDEQPVTSMRQQIGPHLNPLPQGEEDAQRQVRASSKIFWRIVDLLVGGLFVFAGLTKLVNLDHVIADIQHLQFTNLLVDLQRLQFANPADFAMDIDNYKILHWPVAVALGFYLPWLEIFCGLALIFRWVYRGGLSILVALLAVFLVATTAAKARGLDITCGCFGHASQHWSFATHLALDLILLGFVVGLWFRTKQSLT